MEEPVFPSSGEVASIVAESYANCFLKLESQNPGCWSTAGERDDLHFAKLNMTQQRGALVKLVNAIPVPDRNVPFEEIFEFKLKRKDELDLLRHEIDGLFESWISAEDPDHKLRMMVKRIESTCGSLVRVSKESRILFRKSTWWIGFSMSAIAAHSLYGFWEEGKFDSEVLNLGAAVGLLGGGIQFMKDDTPKTSSWKSSPYRYSVHMDRELF